AGTVGLVPQDDAAATLAPPLVKEDGRLRFDVPAPVVSARARGVDPWPGATVLLDGEIVRVFGPTVGATAAGRVMASTPGAVVGLTPGGLLVACADGTAVSFAELQLP